MNSVGFHDTIPTDANHDFGMLYFAEIQQLDAIPSSSEIKEIAYFDQLPENLTYPLTSPVQYREAEKMLISLEKSNG